MITVQDAQQCMEKVRQIVNGKRDIFDLDDLPLNEVVYYDFIYAAMKKSSKSVPIYLECGVWTGRSMAVAHAARPEAVLIGIDMRPPAKIFDIDQMLRKQTIYVQGDTRDLLLVQKLKEELKGNLIDVLFIDSTHDYDTVMKEWDLYFPLMDLRGIILFDDIAIENQVRTHISSIGTYSPLDFIRESQDKRALTDTPESVRQAFEELKDRHRGWQFEVAETGYDNNPAIGVVYGRKSDESSS